MTEPTPTGATVRIRDAGGEADAWYIQRQLHHWFGNGYESQTQLSLDLFDIAGWTPGENVNGAPLETYGVIAEHVADDHRVRIGGGVSLLIDHETAVEELSPGSFNAAVLASEPSVFFLIGIVDSAWRDRGIGARLFDRRLRWAAESDAEMAFSYGWERPGPSSRPLFQSRGWEPVESIESMYVESGRSGCPDCGVWPHDDADCQCDATIWARDVTEVPVDD
jgi:GNAT superfamily N-acetyltransferase